MIEIINIEEKERGKIYHLGIDKRETKIMITWHAMGRSEIWGLDMEKVLDARVYPEEVIIGHYNRYIAHKRHGEHIIRAVYEYNGEMPVVITVYFPYAERYYKGGGTYADKIFS